VTEGGARRRENAGMSSDNPGENPGHRKPEDSYARSVRVGLVGPKPKAKADGDGQQVIIPAPPYWRVQRDTGEMFEPAHGHGRFRRKVEKS
jgi:hypothetical protein